MINLRRMGPTVIVSRVSPDAEISGSTYLTGPGTAVAAGAVVRNSRLHDAVIEAGAVVVDSIIVAEGAAGSHKCDAAGRTVVGGVQPSRVSAAARVSGCTLINTSVGPRSNVTDTWARDCQLGEDNTVARAKLVLVGSGRHVAVTGPTEVSEAHLGHHATIDRRGYFEGIFSNTFRRLRFDESSGRLEVVGAIDLPHVSRYGANTICSTNSGKLLPQPGGVLTGLGGHVGLWGDELLSHEPIELGPCCWVSPWTKVIGQSPAAHATDEELLGDALATCVMPFAAVGFGGELTRGLVMPGELSVGYGPKQRRGAWVFTYAPGAVIEMVRRLHEALEPDRRDLADTIVAEAIDAAIAMTRAMAARRDVDLARPAGEHRGGWAKWLAATHAALTAHRDSGLWHFEAGRPTQWRQAGGRWTSPRIGPVLALAPDALEKQVGEGELLAGRDELPPLRVALPTGAVGAPDCEPEIHPTARIDSFSLISPGCRIGPGTVIGPGAAVWGSDLAGCEVGPSARVERCVVTGGSIGPGAVVRSCRLTDATLGEDSTAEAAAVARSRLADRSTVSALADVADVEAAFPTILGGPVAGARVETHLMSMHLAGRCEHLRALETAVEIDGRIVAVPAIPMIGGGAVIRGSAEQPVRVEGCFIGSNATIERGSYVGFGCFILGRLAAGAGLPPLTLSTGGGAGRHRIGAVLAAMPSTIITHFINWTYQAVGPDGAPAVAELVRQQIERGLRAVEWELAGRAGEPRDDGGPFACYRSLGDYSEAQLRAGLSAYRKALDGGAWEMAFTDGELRFRSDRGQWTERSGSAFWQAT